MAFLDVNVVVALFDPANVASRGGSRLVRTQSQPPMGDLCAHGERAGPRPVLSSPAYPGRRTTVEDAASRLRTLCSNREHVFWPDSISVRDPRTVPLESRSGSSPTYRHISSRAFDIEPW